jgi:hypothetical protein
MALLYLRTGLSQACIADLFGISQPTACEAINEARRKLEATLAPSSWLGPVRETEDDESDDSVFFCFVDSSLFEVAGTFSPELRFLHRSEYKQLSALKFFWSAIREVVSS